MPSRTLWKWASWKSMQAWLASRGNTPSMSRITPSSSWSPSISAKSNGPPAASLALDRISGEPPANMVARCEIWSQVSGATMGLGSTQASWPSPMSSSAATMIAADPPRCVPISRHRRGLSPKIVPNRTTRSDQFIRTGAVWITPMREGPTGSIMRHRKGL